MIPTQEHPAWVRVCMLWILLSLSITLSAQAQAPSPPATEPDTARISLNEAIEIALVNSYVLQRSRLSVEEADEQIRQAWGSVYPQIGGAASYTRNVRTPNPFAGSDAADLFTSFGAIDWLFYNEQQRIEGNPTLTFQDYLDRRQQGLENAGIVQSTGGNPFEIENQFRAWVSCI